MSVEFTKEELLNAWIEISEKLIICLTDEQLETVPALLDLREKILQQIQLARVSGEITKELCDKADRVEKEIYLKMENRVNELRQTLRASSRQKQLNNYDPYESNLNSVLNFYK